MSSGDDMEAAGTRGTVNTTIMFPFPSEFRCETCWANVPIENSFPQGRGGAHRNIFKYKGHSDLKKHIKHHHGIPILTFQCAECGFRSESLKILKKHHSTHEPVAASTTTSKKAAPHRAPRRAKNTQCSAENSPPPRRITRARSVSQSSETSGTQPTTSKNTERYLNTIIDNSSDEDNINPTSSNTVLQPSPPKTDNGMGVVSGATSERLSRDIPVNIHTDNDQLPSNRLVNMESNPSGSLPQPFSQTRPPPGLNDDINIMRDSTTPVATATRTQPDFAANDPSTTTVNTGRNGSEPPSAKPTNDLAESQLTYIFSQFNNFIYKLFTSFNLHFDSRNK